MSRPLPIVAPPSLPQYSEHPSALPVYRWRLRWRDEQRPTAPRQEEYATAGDLPGDERTPWPAPRPN